MAQTKSLRIAYGGYTTAGVKERNEDAFAALLPTEQVRHGKGALASIAEARGIIHEISDRDEETTGHARQRVDAMGETISCLHAETGAQVAHVRNIAENIQRDVNTVIVSLQFEDIVRQLGQCSENRINALLQWTRRLADATTISDGGDWEQYGQSLRLLLEMQAQSATADAGLQAQPASSGTVELF